MRKKGTCEATVWSHCTWKVVGDILHIMPSCEGGRVTDSKMRDKGWMSENGCEVT